MLDIKVALVIIDAMVCQTKIAKGIVDQGGDSLLAVKSNQGKLRQAIEKAFLMWLMISLLSKDTVEYSLASAMFLTVQSLKVTSHAGKARRAL